MVVTRSMLLSQGQFAAFLNAKPSDRADCWRLTGTEISGQISAMVYEQHKAARHALEKFEPGGGHRPVDGGQQQALQESLQVLTDEEKACWPAAEPAAAASVADPPRRAGAAAAAGRHPAAAGPPGAGGRRRRWRSLAGPARRPTASPWERQQADGRPGANPAADRK